MKEGEVVIPKTWRSEFPRLVLFVATAIGSVWLSDHFPRSVITGEILPLGDSSVVLALPLFWLLPALVLGNVLMRIYNVRYSMDSGGLEARIGILSFSQVITRIRFEDIRSIDIEQTIWDRMLDIGLVEMGTAAQAGLEMVFEGIAAPRQVQMMIQQERDARTALSQDSAEVRHQMAL